MLARNGRPAACALLAVLVGCAEEPSFRLGWRITTDAESEDAPALLTVKQCSEVGIEKVRLEVRGAEDPTGVPLRFEHEYSCFHSVFAEGEPIDGPTLAPGEYTLELIGLRRNGGEWLCPAGDGTEVGCVRDQGSVTVREGELPEVAFVLEAPVQCDDGVDNDRDGRVDDHDLACQFGESIEAFDAGLTLFRLSVGLLDNPLIEPDHVGIHEFALEIDGAPFDSLNPTFGLDALWPWRFPLLHDDLDAGPHTLRVVGLDAGGNEVTEAQTIDFAVDPTYGAFVVQEFLFGSDQFLAPIVEPFDVKWGLGVAEDSESCASMFYAVDDVRVRVTEGGGSTLAQDQVFVDGGPLLGEEPGGWVVFGCSTTAALTSTPLTWTDAGYSLEFEGRIGGVSCFSSGSTPLRPGDPLNVFAPRVLDDDGRPPPGCEECQEDDEDDDACGDLHVCELGLCVPK